MRLKEDPHSWRARGIRKKDFQHTHGDPEVAPHKSKRKKDKPKRKKFTCKHVWVEVSYEEYSKYYHRGSWFNYWLYFDDKDKGVMTYFVCAGCEKTKIKENKGKRRAINFRKGAKYSRSY